MVLVFLIATWNLQESSYYFLDGIELHLDNGLVIMTAEEVKEDRFTYSWREEGEFFSYEKRNVKSVKYFSWPVPGVKPKKTTKTAVQRRISGDPVVYKAGGVTFIKVRHVDARGRSTEGRVFNNIIKVLRQAEGGDAGDTLMQLKMVNFVPHYHLELRFYNRKGALLFKVFQDLESLKRSRKDRKEEVLHHQFLLPDSLDFESLGLVEAMLSKKS